MGPVSAEELTALAEKGEINEQTPVIESGKNVWMRWGEMAKKPVEDSSMLNKIVGVYDKVDAFFRAVCVLPAGVADDREVSKAKLGKLSALVGVGTVLCMLFFCLANGLYESLKLFFVLMLTGCVVQYICFQLYQAMVPLLLGKKIKLSSMGMPRALGMVGIVLILGRLVQMTELTRGGDVLASLMGILLMAGVVYACFNADRLFVKIEPDEVSPGREIINHLRFFIRALFSALHVLTPVLMLLSALAFLANGHEGFVATGSLVGDMLAMSAVVEFNSSSLVTICGAMLPILTLFGFCLSSLTLDIVDAIFGAGDRNSNAH